jgi:hypothetical protein
MALVRCRVSRPLASFPPKWYIFYDRRYCYACVPQGNKVTIRVPFIVVCGLDSHPRRR